MRLWELLVNVGALLLFLGMVIKAWVMKTWGEDFVELLCGFGGMVICLFPYEATEYSGHWGWTHRQWRIPPVGWIKFTGTVFLLLAAFSSFTGGTWLDELFRR
jgi:hypothetical protein